METPEPNPLTWTQILVPPQKLVQSISESPELHAQASAPLTRRDWYSLQVLPWDMHFPPTPLGGREGTKFENHAVEPDRVGCEDRGMCLIYT